MCIGPLDTFSSCKLMRKRQRPSLYRDTRLSLSFAYLFGHVVSHVIRQRVTTPPAEEMENLEITAV